MKPLRDRRTQEFAWVQPSRARRGYELRAGDDVYAAIPRIRCDVHSQADVGAVSDVLVGYVDRFSITDVVMASHGRTGLSRVILGSVTDDLLHRLHSPIIVIPVLATGRLEEQPATDRPYAAVATASREQGAS
jgi:nucleotide-binding universal stress UspA family protein